MEKKKKIKKILDKLPQLCYNKFINKRRNNVMDKKTAYKIVYNDLSKYDIFMGTYDAKNGVESYMYGICLVMGNIAHQTDKLGEFEKIFFKNIQKSIAKAKKK